MKLNFTSFTKIKLSHFLGLFLLCSLGLKAQELTGEIIPFTKTFPGPNDSPIIRGDMIVIGNSIIGIQGAAVDGTNIIYGPNDDYNGVSRNNGVFRGYIDIDSDSNPRFDSVFTSTLSDSERNYSGETNLYGSPINANLLDTGTFSSSAAELLINDPLAGETCSTVVKAFLYWGAMYEKESLARGNDDGPDIERPDCTRPDGTPCEFYTDIKILPPGATEYVDIRENNSGTDHTSLKSTVIIDGVPGRVHSFSQTNEVRDQTYACRADVTSLFTHLQDNGETVEGNWTVANVRAVTGLKNTGSGGGWSLVVIYEDQLATFQKNITMFEGYAAITRSGNEDFNSVEFNLSGFQTAPSGPVNVDIATISLEGDTGIAGDQFQINDQNDDQSKSENWVGMTYPGQDVFDFFNSSIYSKGAITRFPNSSNTLGYDSDHFSLANPNNEYIGNSDTEADFRMYTEGDAYGNFFNAFAFEIVAPDLEVIKKISKADGSEFNAFDEVDLGDTINYEITITNTGNDDVVDINYFGQLPINTTLNSLTLNGISLPNEDLTITETSTTDSLTGLPFDIKLINFTIPNTLLEIGESVIITFSVNVAYDCFSLQTCAHSIQSVEEVTYFGEVNNNDGLFFRERSTYESIGCSIAAEGPTLILNNQSPCFSPEFVTISQCTDSIELIGGIGFAEYQWFFEGTRLTIDANGNPINPTDNTIVVNQSGIYTLEQIKSTSVDYLSCQNMETAFQVEIFNPENPIAAFGEPLDPVCAIDGTEIIGVQICSEPIEIETDFPDNTLYSWQKYDPTSGCTQSVENCSFTNASSNCYTEEPNGDSANFTLETEGSYKLSVTVFGGCQFDYFFEAIENCDTLDVNSFEESTEANVILYPNPVLEILHIKNSSSQIMETTTILDLQGRVVLSQEFNETINVESLNSGVYFIVMTTKENLATKQFIKN